MLKIQVNSSQFNVLALPCVLLLFGVGASYQVVLQGYFWLFAQEAGYSNQGRQDEEQVPYLCFLSLVSYYIFYQQLLLTVGVAALGSLFPLVLCTDILLLA